MKNFKKLLALAAVSAAFCCTAVFGACTPKEHEHDWGAWEVTTAATCTQKGEETRVCKDDATHKETRKVDELGHDWGTWTEKSAATCTAAKVEERVCATDGTHKETRNVGEANGHTWDEGTVTTQPTETTAGVKTFHCTVAGCDGSKTEPVPELGHINHTYTGEWQKDADEHWKVCDAANCNEKGQKAAHNWNEGTVTKAATCSEAGVKTYTCGTCSATKTEPVEIVATAHSWGDWADKTAATCTAPKVQERVCAHNSAHKETQSVGEVNPEAHNWGNWEVTENPTANGEGTATRTCTNTGCDAHEEKTLPALNTAGVYEITNNTATCEDAGTANYNYQFEGGAVSFTTATAAKGHNWGPWSISAPTDNTPGSATKVCLTDGCNGEKQTVLPALSEKDEYEYETTATCEMPGQEVYVFVYEGELIQVKTAEAPAKGHNFGAWTEKTPATCTTAKVEERVCTNDNCDEAETRTVGEPLEHDWGEWTEKTPATCTTAKVEERVCSRDATHTETQSVDEPLGHAWGTYTATGGTSVTSAGSVIVTCTREGCNGEEYIFNGGNNGGNTLNGVEDGKTYYLYMPATQTTEKNVTITLKSASVKKGTYEFSFTYLCDEAIVLNTAANISKVITSLTSGAYLKTEKVDNRYVINDDFARNHNIELEYTEDNKLTKVKYNVDDDIVKVGDIKLGVKLTASTKYLVNIKYIAAKALIVGTNSVQATEGASADEYTFTPTETKDYSINVPEGMTVLMNGETLLTAGTWANFAATANEQITFKFINNTAGMYSVTIGDAKPTEFKTGNNDIRISEFDETKMGYTGTYTFTSNEDKKYSLSVPEGVDVLINGEDLIINNTWANFEVAAGETVTFTFMCREENTFTVTIDDAIETPKLTLENSVTMNVNSRPAAGGTPASVEVDVDEEATYIVTISFGVGVGRSVVFFGINSEGSYYEFAGMNSSGNLDFNNYTGTADIAWQGGEIKYNSNDYEAEAQMNKNFFTVTLTLKKGDLLMLAHTNGVADEFTISLEKVEA